MRTVTLGRTGLEVTPLAYGTWRFGGPVGERAAVTGVEYTRSLGISFFGAAQACGSGRSERLLGLDGSARALDLTLGQGDLAEIDRILAAATATGGPTPAGME